MQYMKRLFRKNAPDWVDLPLSSMFWCLHPNRRNAIVFPWKGVFQVYSIDSRVSYRVPGKHNIDRCRLQECQRKLETYSYSDEIAPEPGDFVVDIGAFVGQFSLAVSDIASKVISIEPAPQSFQCLRYNTRKKVNIETYQELITSKNKTTIFNIAEDGSDSSVLPPDSKETKEKIEIDGKTLDRLTNELNIENIDFLKIDAEGAEMDVLYGMSDLSIQKIAIDCSAENTGETTVEPVASFLESSGYHIKINDSEPPEVVFACL